MSLGTPRAKTKNNSRKPKTQNLKQLPPPLSQTPKGTHTQKPKKHREHKKKTN